MRTFAMLLVLTALATAGLSVSAQEEPVKDNGGEAKAPTETAVEPEAEPSPEPAEARAPSHVKFFTMLTDQGNATLSDVYRLAFILYHRRMGDTDKGRARLSGDGYRTALIDAGLIDANFGSGNAAATHQEAAYLFAQAIGLKGGVFWSLTSTQRYAHREMQDRNLFPDENPRQYISGPSLLSSFRDCTEFLNQQAR